jgi:HlyD family secretion protein
MDIPRTPRPGAAYRKTWLIAGGAALLGLTTLGLSRLKPAAPKIEKNTVWIDEVKRGPMVRSVRGIGTLVPEEVRWISAASEGRVERILVQPGATVSADTQLLELSNPDLVLLAQNAESDLRTAQAQLAELRVRLGSDRLDQEAAAARVQADYRLARAQANADAELAKEGLVASLTREKSEIAAAELENRERIERQRLQFGVESIEAQLAMQRTLVEQKAAAARVRREQVRALKVTAGIAGVLQELPVEIGQRVAAGLVLAKVAEPKRLKAVLKIAESQARDVQNGQSASVDTHNGVVPGHVSRVDPAVTQGTVKVDVTFDGPLPKGSRPDLSVDGTIELERLADVVYLGLPAQAVEESDLTVFRLTSETEATRVRVKLGKRSVQSIQVRSGLNVGDRVILSDMSRWDAVDRVRLD